MSATKHAIPLSEIEKLILDPIVKPNIQAAFLDEFNNIIVQNAIQAVVDPDSLAITHEVAMIASFIHDGNIECVMKVVDTGNGSTDYTVLTIEQPDEFSSMGLSKMKAEIHPVSGLLFVSDKLTNEPVITLTV